LGCLQVVLDRGEDEDWLASSSIQMFAVVAAIGLIGAVAWLLLAKRPVVNLRALADRNFALGSLMIFGMAMVLYASAVLIPQLAQSQLGYNATWAGLILSPGTILTILFIPIVLRLMRRVQTRFIIGFGFAALGVSLLYAATLDPQIDFLTLALMRAAQTAALAFLFVPISTVAYSTLAPALNGDAACLYTMFRNIGGSVGIALATAYVTEHTQIHMAYLSQHLSTLDPAYAATLQQQGKAFAALGMAPANLLSATMAHLYQTLQSQAAILAYVDAFHVSACLALLLVPLAMLFTPIKAGGRLPKGH
jgi:DHA2 family multidrug resistance protein